MQANRLPTGIKMYKICTLLKIRFTSKVYLCENGEFYDLIILRHALHKATYLLLFHTFNLQSKMIFSAS